MNFDPAFPVPLVATLAITAVGLAVWREISGRRRLVPAWWHVPCLLLRIAALLLLVGILLNPSLPVSSEPDDGHSVILLDASLSMGLAAEDGATRWQVAKQFAESARQKISSSDMTEARLQSFTSDLDAGGIAEQPSGRQSNLAAALERLWAIPGTIEF